MDVVLSHHAARRAQQRAVPPAVLDWLMAFGEEEHLGQGVRRYSFSRRTWKRLIAYLGCLGLREPEKARSAFALVASDDAIITAGYRIRRLKSAW